MASRLGGVPSAVRVRPLGRKSRSMLAATVAAGASALLIGGLGATASATPAPQKPASPQTVASVTQKLGQLARQNEALTEKFNLAQATVTSDQKKAVAAQQAASAALRAFQTERAQLGQTVVAQYEGNAMSQAGALLASSSGSSYLDSARDLAALSQHQGDMLAQLTAAKAAAASAQQQAAALLTQVTATRDALAGQRTKLTADIAKYRALLATLSAAQQAAYTSRNQAPASVVTAVTQTVHAGNKAAQTAVDFALKQVGKPYVFAAAGPGTYDCSGLTMASWSAAGVSLPHNAEAQYAFGTHVAESALQPGDLIFFYQPIGHVTIYIGDGLMVSAPEPGENVQVVSLAHFQSDYVGATRLT